MRGWRSLLGCGLAMTLASGAVAAAASGSESESGSSAVPGSVYEETVTSARDLVEEVGVLWGPRSSKRGIEFVLRYVPGTPSHVIGDAGRIRQVLVNLVSNALKFTNEGHVSVTVRADRDTAEAAEIRIAVEDSGMGIPPEKLSVIFDKFTQADASTTRRYGGTGDVHGEAQRWGTGVFSGSGDLEGSPLRRHPCGHPGNGCSPAGGP